MRDQGLVFCGYLEVLQGIWDLDAGSQPFFGQNGPREECGVFFPCARSLVYLI